MKDAVARMGRVVDEEDRPVAGALVSVTSGSAPTPETGRRTDAGGSFRVALPPGRFRIEAVLPDGRRGECEASGGAGEAIVIRVEARPGRGGGRES